MGDMTVFSVIMIVIVILSVITIILNVKTGSADRRYAADQAARASVLAAREAAQATIEAAKVAQMGQVQKVKVLGCLGLMAAVVVAVFMGAVAVRGISEWGNTSRYHARQDTLVELDYNATIRHGQTMNFLTEREWASAYARQGKGGPSVFQFIFLAIVMIGGTIVGMIFVRARQVDG